MSVSPGWPVDLPRHPASRDRLSPTGSAATVSAAVGWSPAPGRWRSCRSWRSSSPPWRLVVAVVPRGRRDVRHAVATHLQAGGRPRTWPWACPPRWRAASVPWWRIVLATGTVPLTGIAIIPSPGIIIGNTMTAAHPRRAAHFAALREEHGQYEAALSLGLHLEPGDRRDHHRRVPEALVPGLDQVRTTGVVTLPGAVHRRHAGWRRAGPGGDGAGARALRDHGGADRHRGRGRGG